MVHLVALNMGNYGRVCLCRQEQIHYTGASNLYASTSPSWPTKAQTDILFSYFYYWLWNIIRSCWDKMQQTQNNEQIILLFDKFDLL